MCGTVGDAFDYLPTLSKGSPELVIAVGKSVTCADPGRLSLVRIHSISRQYRRRGVHGLVKDDRHAVAFPRMGHRTESFAQVLSNCLS